jgi:hypothetical protein
MMGEKIIGLAEMGVYEASAIQEISMAMNDLSVSAENIEKVAVII